MKIGIIGVGVVGGALLNYFKKHHDESEIACYDPKTYPVNPGQAFKAENIFICVPVGTNDDYKQDLSILEETISMVSKNSNIFIRSTVLPGTCDHLSLEYNCKVISMPEFLTERDSQLWMDILPLIVGSNYEIHETIDDLFPDKEKIYMKAKEAEMTKYAHNCLGAMKVNYFNIIKEITEVLDINYESIMKGIMITGFFTPEHTQVPGPDGKYGFGGKCFPKDLKAFKRFLWHIEPKLSNLLDAIIKDNEYFRSKSIKDS